jgi:hypothetical protein
MISIFVDETSDEKHRDYFGLCCTAIHHSFYPQIKRECQQILRDGGWDFNVEFKGAYLFSAKKGCIEIDIDKRIELAEKILELTTAPKNARMKLSYFRTSSTDHKKDYLEYLPFLVRDILGKYSFSRRQGKNLVVVTCDNRPDISIRELREAILPVIADRKYELFEDVIQVNSNCETIGVLFSDIIGYLMSRIETITSDVDLFENLTPEQIEKNGKLRKLASSWQLIDKIKKMTIYGLKDQGGG